MKNITLEKYIPFIDTPVLEKLNKLSDKLRGATIQHINSTRTGGGVAELLKSLVPLMQSIGLNAKWDVIEGNTDFFEVTKTFHNSFHGVKIDVTQEMLDIYRKNNRDNFDIIDPQADFVIIHDQQPLGLTEIKSHHSGKWIWYCHIDPIQVDPVVWTFLSQYAQKCDAAIYHLEEYAKYLGHRQFFLPPGIDPLSEKNREISTTEQNAVIEKLNISLDLPIILQVSRFDRLKNPAGVIKAFRRLIQDIPAYLILAGGAATDDPEGQAVHKELLESTRNEPYIRSLSLPPTSHLEINVLQRLANVVVQNSTREGFGLTVTEALWKGKPVIARPVGGIRTQIIDEITGLFAEDNTDLYHWMYRLLRKPEVSRRLGENGKEHVRKNFILPIYLYRWLEVLDQLTTKKSK